MTMVAMITPENTVTITDVNATAEFLREFIGGHFEGHTFPTKHQQIMLCHGDGKQLQLPINAIATALFQIVTGHFDVVVGNVVIMGYDSAGDNADLHKWMFGKIVEAAAQAKAELQ